MNEETSQCYQPADDFLVVMATVQWVSMESSFTLVVFSVSHGEQILRCAIGNGCRWRCQSDCGCWCGCWCGGRGWQLTWGWNTSAVACTAEESEFMWPTSKYICWLAESIESRPYWKWGVIYMFETLVQKGHLDQLIKSIRIKNVVGTIQI